VGGDAVHVAAFGRWQGAPIDFRSAVAVPRSWAAWSCWPAIALEDGGIVQATPARRILGKVVLDVRR